MVYQNFNQLMIELQTPFKLSLHSKTFEGIVFEGYETNPQEESDEKKRNQTGSK